MADETYRSTKTSASTMDFDPIVLPKRDAVAHEHSRKLLVAQGVKNERDAADPLKVRIVYQKRHRKGACPDEECWENLQRRKLTDVKAGEEVQIDLDSLQTTKLIEHLNGLFKAAGGGIVPGRRAHVAVPEDDAEFAKSVRAALAASETKRAILASLVAEADPDLVEAQALRARHERRKAAVAEFEDHMEALDWSEGQWEDFFRRNEWIFGHALAFQFLGEVKKQPVYEGADVTGKGAKRGDYLMATRASVRFTVLVEIKTPEAPLVLEKTYRNGAHVIGEDLVGGVAQVQSSCRSWAVQSRDPRNMDLLEQEEGVFTVEPRGIVVVGNTKTLKKKRAMRETFESFRANLHNPQVVTFDELLERARWLVRHELEGEAAVVDPETGEVRG